MTSPSFLNLILWFSRVMSAFWHPFCLAVCYLIGTRLVRNLHAAGVLVFQKSTFVFFLLFFLKRVGLTPNFSPSSPATNSRAHTAWRFLVAQGRGRASPRVDCEAFGITVPHGFGCMRAPISHVSSQKAVWGKVSQAPPWPCLWDKRSLFPTAFYLGEF